MMKPKWMNNIKAVGWDLDGTLYEPDSIPWELVENARLKKVMEKTGWSESKSRKEYERIYNQLNSNTKTLTALGVGGEGFFTQLWDDLSLQNYIKADGKVGKIIEKVSSLGYRQFVLSNSNREDQIERKLKLIGIDTSLFEFLVATVGLGAVKPDAKPFLEALRMLNKDTSGSNLEVEAQNVLYVGDRERTDVVGAKRVGMKTCLVWGKSELADVSFPTVYDVLDIF